MLTPDQLGDYFADDLGDERAHQRPVHVPLAVQHQHLPELGAGPPLPDDLAQRRDQHPPRQHQLDARPRGAVRLGPVRAGRRQEAPADHPRGPQRHRLPRQRGRAAGQVGLQPAARHDDADPRGVGEPRDDVAGEEGLLRLPHLPDGAVGRPGVDRPSPTARSSARSSTATACGPAATSSPRTAWSSWPPRSARWTSPPRTSSSRAGSSRARCSWSTWSRAGSSTTRS